MCHPASFVLTKDRCFWSLKTDSHTPAHHRDPNPERNDYGKRTSAASERMRTLVGPSVRRQ